MQFREDPLGQRSTDAGHACEVLDAGGVNALQSAEMRKQRPASRGANAADLLQRRRCASLAATRSVALNREAVSFVANLLQQEKPGVIRRQMQRLLPIREDDFLQTRLALGTLGHAEQPRC